MIAVCAAAACCAGAATSAHAAIPEVSVVGGTIPEGTGGPTTATFTLTSSLPAPAGGIAIPYATENGTATIGKDFTAVGAVSPTATQVSGVATIPEGETSATVSVSVVGDAIDEDDQTFKLRITSTPSGTTVGTNPGTMTITDDDDPPVISIADGYEGSDPLNPLSEGTGPNRAMTFRVSLSAPSEKTITVHYDTVPGTATQQDSDNGITGDYQRPGGTRTLTIPAGTTQPSSITVQIIADSIDEIDESFQVQLSLPVNVTLSPTASIATGTIRDDDGPAANVLDVKVDEGAAGTTTNADVTVVLDKTSIQDVTYVFTTADGTAKAPDDYDAVATGQELTIPAGRLTATVRLTVRGDDADEADETFKLNLGVRANGSIADGTATVTVTDDDAAPALGVASVAVPEGTGGASTASLTVALSQPAGRVIKVGYATSDGTATAGVDYQLTSGTLTFNPGDVRMTVSVPLAADATLETDETFAVTAFHTTTDAAGATVQDTSLPAAVGTVTIVDDDLNSGNTPKVSVGTARVPEGDDGTRTATFALRLDAPSPRPVSVRYATADGTAKAGTDYLAAVGIAAFAPGETTTTVTVEVLGDRLVEPSEDFTVRLADPVNARVGEGDGLAIIVDDDAGGGPISVGGVRGASVDEPLTVPLTTLVCDTSHACTGVPVRWNVARAGTIRLTVTADFPVKVKPPTTKPKPKTPDAKPKTRAAAPAPPKVKTVRLFTRTIKVKAGSGSSAVRRSAGSAATRLLADLRRANVKTGMIVVTFTNREGAQETPTRRALAIDDDEAGGGPLSLTAPRLRISSLVCASGCRGTALRWRTTTAGRFTIVVRGLVPPKKGAKRRTSTRLFDMRFAAPRGSHRHALVLRGSRAAAVRSTLRRNGIRRLELDVTFTAKGRKPQRATLALTVV